MGIKLFFAILISSLAAKGDVDGLMAWHLAGIDMEQTDYGGRTPLQVVSVATAVHEMESYHSTYAQNIHATCPLVDSSSQTVCFGISGHYGKLTEALPSLQGDSQEIIPCFWFLWWVVTHVGCGLWWCSSGGL